MSARTLSEAFSLPKRRVTRAPHRMLRVESLERREVLAATNWMEFLPDDTYLSELSLPGTHDTLSDCDSQGTCTVFTNVARAQNRTLPQQLQDGIRVLDVRVDHAFSGTTVGAPAGYTYFFGIVHGMVPMGHEFRDDVLKVVADFMAANPSETIVMQIQEQDALTPATGRAFIDTFEQYMNDTNPNTGASYGDLFWQPGADRIPTLGEVRGKIVLMQDDWDGLESKDSPDPRVQRWGLDYTRNDDGEAGNPNYYNGLFQKVTTEAGLNVNDRWADSLEFFAETRD